jgi:hypothetical protein
VDGKNSLTMSLKSLTSNATKSFSFFGESQLKKKQNLLTQLSTAFSKLPIPHHSQQAKASSPQVTVTSFSLLLRLQQIPRKIRQNSHRLEPRLISITGTQVFKLKGKAILRV